ncbi:hypothetical protein P5V15_000885 [Pogonomyrmex californicus]
MDNSLAALINVDGINSLKYLRILSLSRNNIKTFSGLEALGDHLEELWISYNLIEKIKGVSALKALKVLYMGNNLVKDWAEFNRLQEIPNLQDLLFINNPIFVRRLPTLKKLDAIPIVYVVFSNRKFYINRCTVLHKLRLKTLPNFFPFSRHADED